MARIHGLALMFAAFLMFAPRADAMPRIGERIPEFDIADVGGRAHSTRELAGRRTLVLAMTEQGAADAMRAWGRAAETRVPTDVRRVNLVLLNLAFFIPTATARSSAQSQTPRPYWSDTWFDVHNDRARAANLDDSDTPYVFVLDASGRIVASAHARVNDPGAEAIWRALGA